MAYQNILNRTAPLISIIASGLLLLATFPPLNLYGLAYVALIPIVFTLQKKCHHPFWIGLGFGSFFFGLFNTWIIPLKSFAPFSIIFFLWISYSIFLGCWYGSLFWVIKRFKLNHPFTIASVWTLMEILKGLGPFGNPSGSIGYSQAYHSLWNPILNIIGTYGLSFIIVAINVYLLHCIIHPHKVKKTFAIACTLFIVPYIYGIYFKNPSPSSQPIPITIVQPNFAQKEKLNPNKHPQLESQLLSQIQNITTNNHLIVLPETVITRFNLQIPSFMNTIHQFIKQSSNTIIFGSSTSESSKTYNSLVQISNNLSQQYYHKSKLMPFGEYTPQRKWLEKTPFIKPFLPHDFMPGPPPTPLLYKNIPYGPTICLEAIYANLYRQQAKKNSAFFILASNSAWFYNSTAAIKLFSIAIHRAIENNRFIICASNTGQSGIITNTGTPIMLSQHENKNYSTTISPIHQQTIYTKTGDIPMIILCAIILLFCFGNRRQTHSTGHIKENIKTQN